MAIIANMKDTDEFALGRCCFGPKKSDNLTSIVKHFFGQVTIGSLRRLFFTVLAVPGMLVDLTVRNLQSEPGTAIFNVTM